MNRDEELLMMVFGSQAQRNWQRLQMDRADPALFEECYGSIIAQPELEELWRLPEALGGFYNV